jgi:ankyrin repeat protein
MMSAENGHLDTCRFLIRCGADVDAKDKYSDLLSPLMIPADACCNREQRTALMLSALAGHIDICHVLVRCGADVNAKDEYSDIFLHLPLYLRYELTPVVTGLNLRP